MKERIIYRFRRVMRRYRILRGPLTICLFVVLIIYNFFYGLFHGTKKMMAILVLLLFYTVSCSFCAPMFEIVAGQEDDIWEDHFAEEDIAFAEDDLLLANELVVQVSAEQIAAGETAGSEIVEAKGESGLAVDEALAVQEGAEDYSLDEILDQREENAGFDEAQTAKGSPSVLSSGRSDGIVTIDPDSDQSWSLLLVNKQHPIPEDYHFTLGTIAGSLQCDERIIPELYDMLRAAKSDNINLVICSPYRNLERQQMLFNRKITNYMGRGMSYLDAYKYASQAVTIPGSSEHQLGLALDIYTNTYTSLDEGFGETKAGIWLHDHCAEYGFILRYPKGKEYITSIEYEPWHFRYVGKEAAAAIMAQGICLEEYLNVY